MTTPDCTCEATCCCERPSPDPMTKTQDELLAAVISDEEIIRVHGRANFGTMSPREVVNDGVWKSAVGYHCGHTQFSILREHGLITKPRGMSYDVNLTKRIGPYVVRQSVGAVAAVPRESPITSGAVAYMAFIAAANPSTILKLIAAARSLPEGGEG